MANVLNQIISNKPINNPSMQAKPAYTIDTTGKVKPLEDKAKLLPSRIFGSPIEYAKDLKQDVLNIGKAVKGKANDHELGRINDLGMKLGAGALAAYLFVKNPLKLGKAMEIIGAGTFFATMALWPKLAIQAPIKARTGVDIHQKYVDSQGRKKMLHQDPQYDLTDLYSKEDLDIMGKKLKVDENLPDRNRFIKQRAKKTAIQGNTLWMMTAGLATPLGSALMCNALEKPVSTGIEKANLALTQKILGNKNITGKIVESTVKSDMKFISKFCEAHADEALSTTMINKLVERMTKGLPEEIKVAVKQQIEDMVSSKMAEETLKTVLEKCGVSKDVIADLDPVAKKEFVSLLSQGPKKCKKLATFITNNGGNLDKFGEIIASTRTSTLSVGQFKSKLTDLGKILGETRAKNGIISKFIEARVGDVQHSHIANQWGKATKKFMKSLKLSDKELKAFANGDFSALDGKMTELAKNQSFEDKFLSIVDGYENVTGKKFIETVKSKTDDLFETTAQALNKNNFGIIADAFSNKEAGSASRNIVSRTADRALGAKASFYRMFNAVDIRKNLDALKDSLRNSGMAEDRIEDLVNVCKKVSFEATSTDFVEKLKSCGFELSNEEFKAVSRALFEKVEKADINESKKGFLKYCKNFIENVINRDNGIVIENSRCHLGKVQDPLYEQLNTTVGSSLKNTLQDTAKNMLNSRKWLKIAGGSFAVLTAATLIATLAVGRKGKTEKQVEESNKVNG